MGEGSAGTALMLHRTKAIFYMIVAINDISFLVGFKSKYDALQALIQFGETALGIRDERVSNVNAAVDIVNSPNVNKNLLLAPEYTLIQALNELKQENREKYLFILQIMTQCGIPDTDEHEEEFSICGLLSRHCAQYRNHFLLSICSADVFLQEKVTGFLKNGAECTIRNLSNNEHKYVYWEELGFREYEWNKKHGTREYYRARGIKVNIAPETDELGQELLNQAVELNGRIFSVDRARNNRIFEFRHSYANKFHGYLQKEIPKDMEQKIIKQYSMQNIE